MKKTLLSLIVITSFLAFVFSTPTVANTNVAYENDSTTLNDTTILNDTISINNITYEGYVVKSVLSSGIVVITKNGHVYDLSGKLIQ